MPSIPSHGRFSLASVEENLRLMLRAGYKVTVAEQEEELREGANFWNVLSHESTRRVHFTKNL